MNEDLKQYVTNLLYYAYAEANNIKPPEFDQWVEEMIDGIDEYFKSQPEAQQDVGKGKCEKKEK
jgi:hypothetical protein